MDLNDQILYADAIDLLCVKGPIGSGLTRTVYDCALLDGCVVKIEKDPGQHNQNWNEFNTWCLVKDTEFAKWFAPVEWISQNGRILIMKKTWKASELNLPKRIPVFFTDAHRGNFGLNIQHDPEKGHIVSSHLVCHDYGFTRLMKTGLTRRMRDVDWDNPGKAS